MSISSSLVVSELDDYTLCAQLLGHVIRVFLEDDHRVRKVNWHTEVLKLVKWWTQIIQSVKKFESDT